MPAARHRKFFSPLTACVLGLVVLFCISHRASHAPQQKAPIPQPLPVSPVIPSVAAADQPGLLTNPLADLRQQSDPRITRQVLAKLRAKLAAMPRNEALDAIRKFLDSKADAPTHFGFKLDLNGQLEDAPTFRTFLLDELARLDPAAAAEYSRVILASMDSPDEWAVALRNLALGDPSADGRTLLEQKTAQMLQYTPWQQNPSVGYLEAFDVAVYLGGADLIPTLSGMIRAQDNPALGHAAYLAMDRLVINSPDTVLQSLAADPTLLAGREATRADFFARANVADPQQRQILESYLLNPAISPSEIETFAGIFPNANFMISPNLLTQNTTIDHDTLVNRDAQSLAAVQQWLSDPRFANVAPELQTINQRLQTFANEAGK